MINPAVLLYWGPRVLWCRLFGHRFEPEGPTYRGMQPMACSRCGHLQLTYERIRYDD